MKKLIFISIITLSFLFANSESGLIQRAKAGEVTALYEYGLLKYTKGDYEKALCCFEQASINGDRKSQYYVGYLNHKGLGTVKNIDDAIYWYLKAIKNNNQDALYELALIYLNEDDYKDTKKARVYFYKAKMQGHQKASIEYTKLAPTILDKVKATKNYKLGLLYYEGKTLQRNLYKSLEYFEQSAKYGSQKAHFRLGFMYFSGVEVKKDLTKAHYHLEKASYGKNRAIANKSKEIIAIIEE
jgi:TPR repeat protein